MSGTGQHRLWLCLRVRRTGLTRLRSLVIPTIKRLLLGSMGLIYNIIIGSIKNLLQGEQYVNDS